MPPKKKNAKKKAGKMELVPYKAPKSKPKTAKAPKVSGIELTETVVHKPVFDIRSAKGGNEMHLHIKDLLDVQQGPVDLNSANRGFALTYPFTVGVAANGIGSFAAIPKLRNMAGDYSRFKVKRARLHYAPMCPATTQGNVSFAILPGYNEGFSSANEYAASQYSAVVPVWKAVSTPWWTNKEQRWFWCRDTNSGNPNDIIPFTIDILIQDMINQTAMGLLWIELELMLTDFVVPPQASASFKMDQYQTASDAGTSIGFQKCQRMDGLWQWAGRQIRQYFQGGTTPGNLSPGAAVGTDPGLKEIFFDLLFSGVGAELDELEPKRNRRRAAVWKPYEIRKFDPAVSIAAGQVLFSMPDTDSRLDPDEVARATAARKPRAPNASDDVTITLYFQPLNNTDFGAVYSTLYQPAISGPIEINGQWSGAINEPGYVWLQAQCYTGESRVLQPTSSFALDTVVSTTSS